MVEIIDPKLHWPKKSSGFVSCRHSETWAKGGSVIFNTWLSLAPGISPSCQGKEHGGVPKEPFNRPGLEEAHPLSACVLFARIQLHGYTEKQGRLPGNVI